MKTLTQLQVLSMRPDLVKMLEDVQTAQDFQHFKTMLKISHIQYNMLYLEPLPRHRLEFTEEPDYE